MDLIKKTLQIFVYVTAGITINAAIFISLFTPDANLSKAILWQIIIMAATCACGNIIFISRKEISKRNMKIRHGFHYLYINIVVFSEAILFQWIRTKEIPEDLFMFFLILIVYVSVMTVMFFQEEKIAKTLNDRLKKINTSKE